jgi:type II secretory pathway component GspD/PulD (secretin)
LQLWAVCSRRIFAHLTNGLTLMRRGTRSIDVRIRPWFAFAIGGQLPMHGRRWAAVLLTLAVTVGVELAAASPASPAAVISSSSAGISISAENEPLREVLLQLGKQLGVNVVVGTDVQGRVSLSIHDVSLDEALSALTGQLGYTYHRSHGLIFVGTSAPQHVAAQPIASPSSGPAVLPVTVISVDRAASVLERLYPHAQISVDHAANAVIVVAPADQVQAMRQVLQGLDVQNPTRPTTEVIQLHTTDPKVVVQRLQLLYPNTRLTSGPNKTVIVVAPPLEMAQIKAVVASIDTPVATPAPTFAPAEAVKVLQARPQDVARIVSRQFADVRVSVTGPTIVLSGPPDDVAKAKSLIGLLDQPQVGSRFTQVYRLRFVDAKSVGNLIGRSFGDVSVTVDEDLNAISVSATASEQQRIADSIAQLDVQPGSVTYGANGLPGAQLGTAVAAGTGPGGTNTEVYTLRAALPAQTTGASTSATDIATAVTQSLQQTAPDLRITVPNNSTQLVMTGSPYSIRLAKELIEKLDVTPQQVVLDTEVLEVQETVAKNLGLLFPQPVISATYTEIAPIAPPSGGTPPPLLGIQPWTRTPISITAQLNFLVQTGNARVLADPRITTVSGRTATIRAGDTLSILTTAGGSAGTVATTQVVNFNTGVTLDITPIVNTGDVISVTLHPVVNSLAGVTNGVPQISTRDTLTTVSLKDNQTLVIGGLIQETTTRQVNKLPLLGDIPVVGRLFQNIETNNTRNELIIVVTPHLLRDGVPVTIPGPTINAMPTPAALPTLPPNAHLPPPTGQLPPAGPSPALGVPQTPTPQILPTPLPTSSAMAATNVFVYGSPPPNNYAGPTAGVQIFYVQLSPTVVREGTIIQVSAITTSNANTVAIGSTVSMVPLTKIGPGQWQVTFPFHSVASMASQSQIQLMLTASNSGTSSVSVPIPVNVTQ